MDDKRQTGTMPEVAARSQPSDANGEGLREAAAGTNVYRYVGLFSVTIGVLVAFSKFVAQSGDYLQYIVVSACILLFFVLLDLVLGVRSQAVRLAFVLAMLAISILGALLAFSPGFSRYLSGQGHPAQPQQSSVPSTAQPAVATTAYGRAVVQLPPGGYAYSASPACRPNGPATCAVPCAILPPGATVVQVIGIMGEGNAPQKDEELSHCGSIGDDCAIGWSKLANLTNSNGRVCVEARNWSDNRLRYGGVLVEYKPH